MSGDKTQACVHVSHVPMAVFRFPTHVKCIMYRVAGTEGSAMHQRGDRWCQTVLRPWKVCWVLLAPQTPHPAYTVEAPEIGMTRQPSGRK